jgi:hypothetical protein
MGRLSKAKQKLPVVRKLNSKEIRQLCTRTLRTRNNRIKNSRLTNEISPFFIHSMIERAYDKHMKLNLEHEQVAINLHMLAFVALYDHHCQNHYEQLASKAIRIKS